MTIGDQAALGFILILLFTDLTQSATKPNRPTACRPVSAAVAGRFIMPVYLPVWISLTKICRVPSGAMAGNRNASLVRFQHGEASTRNSPDV